MVEEYFDPFDCQVCPEELENQHVLTKEEEDALHSPMDEAIQVLLHEG